MSEKHISSRLLFAGLTVGGGLLLAGCDSKTQNPEIGDTGVTRTLIEGVIDYNQIKIPKDSCKIDPEVSFKIIDESTLTLPSVRSSCYYDKSTDRNECYNEPNIQPIIQLEGNNGCTAWFHTDEIKESSDFDNK